MSGRPSMKFNSHPPNGVFIKAVTITASRRAGPAQLGSTRLCGYILYKEGGDGEGKRVQKGGWETQRVIVRKREREDTVWIRQRRIGAVSSRATEGLNLPKRQLSLLCNLTRMCLTWAWVSTPARHGAQNQLHIGHAENYAAVLFALCILFFITVIALTSIVT